jgi:hypothetical protein
MTVLTSGHIRVTPARLTFRGDLDDLVGLLATDPYEPGQCGWGGIDLDDDADDTPSSIRSAPAAPRVTTGGFDEPVLLARLLEDRPRQSARALPSALQQEVDMDLRYELNALDVLVFADETPGQFTLVASSQNEAQLQSVLQSRLRFTLEDADAGWELSWPHPDLEIPSDLFLWLLAATNGDGHLGETLWLLLIKSLQAQDDSDVATRWLSWASLDRREVLVSLHAPDRRFGPAKVVLIDEEDDVEADLFLKLDGSLDVHVAGSSFGDDPLRTRRARVGMLCVVVRNVLPKLLRLHWDDDEWVRSRREEFYRDARARLQAMIGP